MATVGWIVGVMQEKDAINGPQTSYIEGFDVKSKLWKCAEKVCERVNCGFAWQSQWKEYFQIERNEPNESITWEACDVIFARFLNEIHVSRFLTQLTCLMIQCEWLFSFRGSQRKFYSTSRPIKTRFKSKIQCFQFASITSEKCLFLSIAYFANHLREAYFFRCLFSSLFFLSNDENCNQ